MGLWLYRRAALNCVSILQGRSARSATVDDQAEYGATRPRRRRLRPFTRGQSAVGIIEAVSADGQTEDQSRASEHPQQQAQPRQASGGALLRPDASAHRTSVELLMHSAILAHI
jgi:hypothetical protein